MAVKWTAKKSYPGGVFALLQRKDERSVFAIVCMKGMHFCFSMNRIIIYTSLLYCQMWVSPPYAFGLIFLTERFFFFGDNNIVKKNFKKQ